MSHSDKPVPPLLEYRSGATASRPAIVSFGRLSLAFGVIGFTGSAGMHFLSLACHFRPEMHNALITAPVFLTLPGFGCGIGGLFQAEGRMAAVCGLLFAGIETLVVSLITYI